MRYILPPTHCPPRGHYSPAVVCGGFVFVSGQLPVDMSGQIQGSDVEEQTRCCLQKISEILTYSGSEIGLMVKVSIYLSDISLWPRVNTVYAAFMGEHRPARVVVPCGPLHYGCLVEIDCVAALKPA